MKLSKLFFSALLICFASGGVLADDKAKKQAEVRSAAAAALERFYKADPKLKEAVAKAPGYAVFTSLGLSFVVGGAGGSGLAHDNASRKDVFMNMAKASGGLQAGIDHTDSLIIFKTKKGFATFVDKGWEAGARAGAQAGAADKSVGKAEGGLAVSDSWYYTLTRNGLTAGAAFEGTKFWKDSDLN